MWQFSYCACSNSSFWVGVYSSYFREGTVHVYDNCVWKTDFVLSNGYLIGLAKIPLIVILCIWIEVAVQICWVGAFFCLVSSFKEDYWQSRKWTVRLLFHSKLHVQCWSLHQVLIYTHYFSTSQTTRSTEMRFSSCTEQESGMYVILWVFTAHL